jgi:hypothetical protein
MSFLAGLALLLALQPGEAADPEIARLDVTLSAARMEAGVDGGVDVVARYQLLLPDGTSSVALRGVAFFGARPAALRASLNGEPVEVELGPRELGGAWDSTGVSGIVRFAPTARAEGVAGDGDDAGDAVGSGEAPGLPSRSGEAGTAMLELRYRVDGSLRRRGSDLEVAVPLLLVSGKPAGSREDLFNLRVELPSELEVYEFFPTVPRSIVRDGESAAHLLTLQAIPAVVRWRGRMGEARLITYQTAVDLVTIALLVLLSAVTYKVIRAA